MLKRKLVKGKLQRYETQPDSFSLYPILIFFPYLTMAFAFNFLIPEHNWIQFVSLFQKQHHQSLRAI